MQQVGCVQMLWAHVRGPDKVMSKCHVECWHACALACQSVLLAFGYAQGGESVEAKFC